MAKKKEYTEEEKFAIEKVLDAGFFIENSNGDVIFSHWGDYTIRFNNGDETDFETFEKALDKLFKKH